MKYVRVDSVLPEDLIKEIQKYIQGEYIYIPSCPESRKKWGEKSNNRDFLKNRNAEIYKKYMDGQTVSSLAEEFYLSDSSIKKIIYKKER